MEQQPRRQPYLCCSYLCHCSKFLSYIYVSYGYENVRGLAASIALAYSSVNVLWHKPVVVNTLWFIIASLLCIEMYWMIFVSRHQYICLQILKFTSQVHIKKSQKELSFFFISIRSILVRYCRKSFVSILFAFIYYNIFCVYYIIYFCTSKYINYIVCVRK
jgi:hypothetical protein